MDSVATNPGTGGDSFALDRNPLDSLDWPVVKLGWGTFHIDYKIVDLANGMPVQPGTGTNWAVTNQQTNVTADYDTGVGTQPITMWGIALPAAGGPVAAGTATNPLRTDPTGSTPQPVSGTVTANAGTGTFTTSDSHLPAAGALSDALGNPTTTEIGANLLGWDATNSVWRRVAVDAGTGTLKVDPGLVGVTQSGAWSVTANIGTTGGLALDATLTGGTTKAIARGGAKGTTTAADLTSTAQGANNQALDVQLWSGGAAKDPTQIRALTSADIVTAAQGAANATPWNQNLSQVGGAAVSLGSKASASSIPVVPASDWVDQDVATAATALGALNAAVSVAMAGRNSLGMFLATGTLIGTIVPEISYDGGTTWVATVFVDPTAGAFAYSASVVFAGSNTATSLSIKAGGGVTHARVRVSAFTSGAANCTVRATQNEVGTITIQGKPFVALGFYQASGRTPTYAGLAAAAPLVALRNPSATVLIVPLRVKVQVMTTVAATTAGAAQRELVIGRSWTVSDTGTAVALTGNNNKKRTGHATSIADLKFGGALTAGTRTLDVNAIGQAIGWQPLLHVGALIGNTGSVATAAASAGIGTAGGVDLLDRRSFDEYPVVLAQNEGALIRLGPDAQAAGATNQTYFDIAWAEVTAY